MCDAKWGRISDLGAIKILLLIKTSSKSGGRNPVPNVISLPRALPNEHALRCCVTFSNARTVHSSQVEQGSEFMHWRWLHFSTLERVAWTRCQVNVMKGNRDIEPLKNWPRTWIRWLYRNSKFQWYRTSPSTYRLSISYMVKQEV